ncbi:MAG: hypothetical protein K9M94_14960 [Spirochaetia bacterium]|nr:hypothetical protein [Spirochaetia bacterium]
MVLHNIHVQFGWSIMLREHLSHVHREKEVLKVKELIAELYGHNPEADVMIKDKTACESFWLDQLYFNSPEQDGGRENEETCEILALFDE